MNASANEAADRPTSSTRAGRRPTRLTAVIVVACVVTACSGEDEPTAATAAPDVAAPTDGAPSTTPSTASSDGVTPGTTAPPPAPSGTNASDAPAGTAASDAPDPAIDAPAVFAAALDATATDYHFVSTITLGDQVAVTAEGDHTATNTRMRIDSQGVAVDYLVVDGTSWVFDEGVWQELDDEAAVEDPLGQLADPSEVIVNSTDGDLVRLLATYPAAALGLTGNDIGVIIEIVDERIVTLEYATDIDGALAAVRAELSTLPDPAPAITAPDV